MTELQEKLKHIREDELKRGILTFDNPMEYRDYKIYHNDSPWPGKYAFVHKEYNGPGDYRLGSKDTIEQCIIEINEIEENL